MFSYKDILQGKRQRSYITKLFTEYHLGDTLSVIVSYLDYKEMRNVSLVNKNCHSIVKMNDDFSITSKKFDSYYHDDNVRKTFSKALDDFSEEKDMAIKGKADYTSMIFIISLVLIKKGIVSGEQGLRLVKSSITKIDELTNWKLISKDNKKQLLRIKSCF